MIRFLAVALLLGNIVNANAESEMLALAQNDMGVPEQYVPGLRQMRGADIDAIRDSQGRTLLHIAASRGHQIRSYALLSAGADVNARDAAGWTPLHALLEPVRQQEPDLRIMMLEMLVLGGADLNAQSNDGTTPLACAVGKGDFDAAEYLLWHGAKTNPVGIPPEKLPLAIASREKVSEILKLLQDASPGSESPNPRFPQRKIADAILAADLNSIIDALNGGWDVNETDSDGKTALLRAVEKRREALVHLLVVAGADVNMADKKGRTPLMAALTETGWPHDRMTINLLLRGANAGAKTDSGETALTVAAKAGNDWGILLLAAAGADPKEQTNKGTLANWASHGPTIGLLRRFGVFPDETTARRDNSPAAMLMAAAKQGDIGEVTRLLDSGLPPDVILAKNDQRTALSWAANNNRFDVVDILIARGADINFRSEVTGHHILHSLAGRYQPSDNNQVGRSAAEAIRKLVQRGAQPDIRKKDGTTPLMFAAQCGVTGPNTVALLELGADINARNAMGLSVLGHARKFGREEMVEFLKMRGARD
jgi:ankyrin repeat protein